MFDYRNNPICARYQRGQTKDLEDIKQLIAQHQDDVVNLDEPFIFAIALKDNDELIGEVVVMPNDHVISLGYTVSYKYQRRGYAYEALEALIAFLHAQHPNLEFISFTDPDNIASMNLLQKLGYRSLGYIPSKDSQAFGLWITPETEKEFKDFH